MMIEEIAETPATDNTETQEVIRVLQLAPILLRPDDAAAVLGVSRSSFDRHVAPRVPRVYPGGSLVRYLHDDLVNFAAKTRAELPPL